MFILVLSFPFFFVFFDSITVDLMKKWRVVHLPITLLLGLLSLLHIITITMFSK